MKVKEILERLDKISHEPGRNGEDHDALQKAKSLLYLFIKDKEAEV